jgi:hypothetical protein
MYKIQQFNFNNNSSSKQLHNNFGFRENIERGAEKESSRAGEKFK